MPVGTGGADNGKAGGAVGVDAGTGGAGAAAGGTAPPVALGSSHAKKSGLEEIDDSGTTAPSWRAFTELSATTKWSLNMPSIPAESREGSTGSVTGVPGGGS